MQSANLGFAVFGIHDTLYTIINCHVIHLVSRFLIRGIFLTLAQRSLSTLETLAVLELRLDLVPACHKGSLLRGMLLGWHSSINIARSGARFARHCNLTNACLCLRRCVYDDNACASSESDGRGDDVACRSRMLKSKSEWSKSASYSDGGVSGSKKPSSAVSVSMSVPLETEPLATGDDVMISSDVRACVSS